MMTTKERNDRKSMRKYEGGVRFWLDIRDTANDNLIKVRDILMDVEAKTELMKDALVYFINSEDFDVEKYLGPGHRKVTK